MQQYVQDGPYQLSTMPGLGTVLAAIFEAEIGDIANFPSADQLARLSGIAPAEDSSGTRRRRRHRQYGRRRLNKAFYLLALNQITRRANGKWGNAEAGRYYEKKLAEGKSKKHALRCLMRRLVDIIYAMMRDRSAYRMPGEPTAKVSWWQEAIERLASTKRPSASISETASAGAAGQSEP